jgi:glycosyltransferase involved in cell wall biosynthesis
MTRVLAIATAFVVPENRAVFQSLADDFGCDVTLISPSEWVQTRYGETQRFDVAGETKPNFKVIPLRFGGVRFEKYHGLSTEIKKTKPSIVVCAQEFNSISTVRCLGLTKTLSRNALTVSCSLQNVPNPRMRLRHRALNRVAFALSDGILASCIDAAKLLRSNGYRGHTKVIYPLGAACVHRSHPDRHDPTSPRFTIGFVGRLAAEKGIFDLLAAFSELNDDSHLLFVGDGPDRRQLEALAVERGLSSRVTFAGLVPREKLGTYYESMSVLVLPSRSTPSWKEQFGVVLAEAMVSGIPVIGSNSGAIPEVVGEAGFVFPEGDVASLAEHLRTLRDDARGRLALAASGRARGTAMYTPQAIASQLIDVFATLRSE